jgi:hypothetical protein
MGNDASLLRGCVLRVIDNPVVDQMGGGIDRMHEGRRRHPRTVEKGGLKTSLWQVLDKAEYQGEFNIERLGGACADEKQARKSSTRMTLATTGSMS